MRYPAVILMLCLAGSSCRNDFDLVVPGESIPVIYGLISPQDSVHRIRLTRSFSGSGSALEMAKSCDSLYYPDAEVFLELRNPDGRVIDRKKLQRTLLPDRSDGLFCISPNYDYQCSPMPVIDSDTNHPAHYVLSVTLPGSQKFCYAETVVPPLPSLKMPELWRNQHFIDLFIDNRIGILLPDQYFTEFKVLLHYSELKSGNWSQKQVLHERRYIAAVRNSLTRFDELNLNEDWFINLVVHSIQIDTTVQARHLDQIEFRFTYAGKAFNDLYNSTRFMSDLIATGYSNITGGYGMFSSFNTRFYKDFMLNPRSMDSLVGGICTRPLRFVY